MLSTTKLAADDYYVRVTDSGGCFFTYGDVITITEPSTALSATYSFSNYNGFNVKCFGGSDGQVTVTAIGGNGSPFPSGVYTYSFDGGAYGSTNSLVGIPTGSHTVHVKDERGCVYSENVLLSAPSALTPSLVDKNYIKCFGDNTGFIEVTATGGVPPNYEYKLGTGLFSSNARFSNLTAGSYQITVRDLNGCTATLNQSIASPNPAMTIGISKTNVSCFGLADGKITANVSGGAPTYTYEWTGRTETGNVIQSLAPGTYSIKVSDQEGCSQTTSATITQPLAPLTTSITPKPIQCFGETSGELQLFPTGGTLPYLYTIDNGLNYQVSNKFVGLAKGTYVAKIKDANSCAVSASADIVEPPLLSVSIPDKQNINCYGAATGSITVNATGGVAPYQYSLDGINYKSGSTFNGLPAGTYQARVKDSYGCIRTANTDLTQPPSPLSLSFVTTPVQCKGDANGKVETTVAGGTAPYTYAWQETTQTTATVDALLAKTYHLTVTDAKGCSLGGAVDVTEPAIALQTVVINQSNVSCTGLANGSFDTNTKGGYPPYQFSIDGGAYNTISSYSSLAPATYKVNVRDSKGCLVNVSTKITEPLPLSGTIDNIKYVSCFGLANGQFEVIASGGTAPYQYSKDGGVSFQSGSIFDGLVKGSYSIQIKDSNNCSYALSFSITEPVLLQSSMGSVVNSACGQANGSAKVLPTGGASPYSYQWKNLAGIEISVAQQPTTLLADSYTVITTDANGCTVTASQIINDDNAPTVAISNTTDATCFDSADGSATASATGGAGGYKFAWSDQKAQSSVTATALIRGNYVVTVTDSRGCKGFASAVIGSPTALQYSVILQKAPLCDESCDGEIEIKASGGTAPYSYTWIAGETSIGGKALALCKGTHEVRITDAAQCTTLSQVILDAPTKLDLQVNSITKTTCSDGCDGSITVSSNGGTAPYTFQWNDSQKQTTPQASNLCAGSYAATATDAHGCAIGKTIAIEKTEPLKINLGGSATVCYQQTHTLDPGIDNATYTWTKDQVFFSDKKTITINQAGEYEVKLIDRNGCSAADKFTLRASSLEYDANFLSASGLVIGDTLALTEVCFPKADSMRWTFDSKLKVLSNSSEQPEVTADEPGEYTIMLTGHFGECTDVARKTVTFYKPEDKDKVKDQVALGEYGIKSVTIHPNPTTGLITIEIEMYQPELVAVFLYNLMGTEVTRARDQDKLNYKFEFDLRTNTPGVYMAMIRTDNQSRSLRIVLIN